MGLFTLVFYVVQILCLRRIAVALECLGDDALSRDVLAGDGLGGDDVGIWDAGDGDR